MSAKSEKIKNHEFSDLLYDCRLRKTDLAEEIGIHRGTVYGWQESPPKYVLAFLRERKKNLELMERNAKLKALQQLGLGT